MNNMLIPYGRNSLRKPKVNLNVTSASEEPLVPYAINFRLTTGTTVSCPMGLYQACRVSLDVIAILVLCVGVILSAWGLFTPAWQIGDLYELGEYHEYGLWMDCVKGWTRTAGNPSDFLCFYLPIVEAHYSFPPFAHEEGGAIAASQNQQYQLTQERTQSWRMVSLAFMSICFCLAFIAVFMGCCGTVYKCPAIAWAVLTALATLSGLIAVINFAVNTMYPQHRFRLMTLNTAWLRLGRSFYCALAGVIILIIATMLSITCVIMLCMQSTVYINARKSRYDRTKDYVLRARGQTVTTTTTTPAPVLEWKKY